MRKIFILLALLPFSLWAELDPTDLDVIEGSLDNIKQSSYLIENDVNEIVNYVSLLTGRTYEIIQGQSATKTEVVKIKSLLTDLNYLVESLKGDLNNYLPSLDTNLQNAVISLGYCQNYLNDIKNTTSNIYDELSKLGTISEDLVSIKNLLYEKCSIICATLEEINTTTQDIYDELISHGLDIKDISATLKNIFVTPLNIFELKTRFWTYSNVSQIGSPAALSQYVISQYRNTSSNFFNYVSRLLAKSYDLQGMTHLTLENFAFRLYDIQTNIYTIVSALTDKKEEQKITNQFDNVSNTFRGDIKQEYEGSEGDLNDLEYQIKAQNQSFQQNQSIVQQFQNLVAQFQVDSLPSSAVISIVNFKIGDDSGLPSQSSIEINLQQYFIIFRCVRGCFTVVYWGIVLFLGYKITFFFVRFVRSNVLGIIPSTNKSDDGSFS